MTDSSSVSVPALESGPLLLWARDEGLVASAREVRRLAAMRLEVLAGGALPGRDAADVLLTAQWAVFICWVDDQIDRRGLGSVPGELERFTAALRAVLTPDEPPDVSTAPAEVLARLLERTAMGMPPAWRSRFTTDYLDFLRACEEEAALRRARAGLPLADYLDLRRRTITLLPMLDVLERTGHAPMPENAQLAAQINDLRQAVADVAGWANDLASAADDASAGQDNLVTLLAREDGCSTAEARARVAAMVEERRSGLCSTAQALRATPGLSPARIQQVIRYVDLTERFMAAIVHWLTITGRFADVSDPAPPPS
ncbi:terpene synthase family protein [Kitasatospora sp. NPDC087314]|uniref:terpene synthase family protein n=1 Tax=Kitasatospora sp. NPDC087314 TaxID=3364068 RepID=UPI0037FD91C3